MAKFTLITTPALSEGPWRPGVLAAQRSARLCQTCEATFLERADDGKPDSKRPIFITSAFQLVQQHHTSIQGIRRSQQAGCPICGWLIARLNGASNTYTVLDGQDRPPQALVEPLCLSSTLAINQQYNPELLAKQSYDPRQDHNCLAAKLQISRATPIELANRSDYIELCDVMQQNFKHFQHSSSEWEHRVESINVLLEDSDDPEPTSDYAFCATNNSGSHETRALVAQWLRNCDLHHSHCRMNVKRAWRPTRLIQMKCNRSGVLECRLSELQVNELTLDIPYIALSHRWLVDDPIVLKRETLEGFRQSIPVQYVKRSIQDAMRLALELGIQYLWSDTLCIVQDDPEDVQKETLRMEKIYRSAYCTISADNSYAVNDSLFSEREEIFLANYAVPLDYGLVQSKAVAPRIHRLRLDWKESEAELDSSPLRKRAWIFQERMLSTRTIHFCTTQVHWVCRCLRASETHPEGSRKLPGMEEVLQVNLQYGTIDPGNVPVMVHHNDVDKSYREAQWNQTWWHGSARQLVQERRHLGRRILNEGIHTDNGTLVSWEELCPSTYESELFRDGTTERGRTGLL